ncbi:MAG: hypothetical protein ACI4LX_08825 [Treponema sp.]
MNCVRILTDFSRKIFFLFLISFFASFSFAQNSTENSGQNEDLPSGYGGVNLGMTVDETKDALKKNSDFGYNGDRDVSLLPGENRILIETDARDFARWSFLEQCWFQFFEDKLYIITLNLNRKKVDYYSVYSSLCKKYGEPVEFSPERAVWRNDTVQFSLERPLALKYIQLETFNSLIDESRVEKTANEKLREDFLDSL